MKRNQETNEFQFKKSRYDQQYGKDTGKSNVPVVKELPNYAPSGLLSKVLKNGVELKYREPGDSIAPKAPKRLFVYKDKNLLESFNLSRSSYLVGSDSKIVDIKLSHPSISKQHACFQYRKVKDEIRLYLIDLESSNGTFCNGEDVGVRYYQILSQDVIKFGGSSREYVVMDEID